MYFFIKISINLGDYTEFEIANFVVDNPSILKLANMLYESKSIAAGSSLNNTKPFVFQNEKVNQYFIKTIINLYLNNK